MVRAESQRKFLLEILQCASGNIQKGQSVSGLVSRVVVVCPEPVAYVPAAAVLYVPTRLGAGSRGLRVTCAMPNVTDALTQPDLAKRIC